MNEVTKVGGSAPLAILKPVRFLDMMSRAGVHACWLARSAAKSIGQPRTQLGLDGQRN